MLRHTLLLGVPNCTPVRSAPERFAQVRSDPVERSRARSAPVRFALVRMAAGEDCHIT